MQRPRLGGEGAAQKIQGLEYHGHGMNSLDQPCSGPVHLQFLVQTHAVQRFQPGLRAVDKFRKDLPQECGDYILKCGGLRLGYILQAGTGPSLGSFARVRLAMPWMGS